MDHQREYFACLALRHTPGVGARTWKSVLQSYPTAYDAVQDAANWPGRGVAGKRPAKACAEESWREAAENEYRDARHRRLGVISWHDPRYPQRLKDIPAPPAYFYYRGDPSLLKAPAVAVVGARECTRFGLEAADRISRDLSQAGVTVVSGLAAGIDRQAHQAALQGVGSTVAVLGTGIDVPYPASNVELLKAVSRKGCAVSEFAPGTRPESRNFPTRNRIISGLSLGVLVAEASGKSGSLITARLAAEQGREVFALPGPVGHATFTGCHRLIRQGATLVEGAEDIVNELRYQFSLELASADSEKRENSGKNGAESAPDEPSFAEQVRKEARKQSRHLPEEQLPELEGDELVLFERLVGTDRLHVDEIARALQWESSRVSTGLIMLEMKGLLRQLPGMWYTAREA